MNAANVVGVFLAEFGKSSFAKRVKLLTEGFELFGGEDATFIFIGILSFRHGAAPKCESKRKIRGLEVERDLSDGLADAQLNALTIFIEEFSGPQIEHGPGGFGAGALKTNACATAVLRCAAGGFDRAQ